MFRRLRFWLWIAIAALRERIAGVRCGCGEHTWLPARGWRFTTWTSGDSVWVCPECLWQSAEPTQW